MAESRKVMKAEKTICIYCMGDYGLETYFKLKERGVKIDFFADRDPEKQGYALDHLYCISYEELLERDREEIIIIVAIKKPGVLIAHFREEGFQYVYDKETAVQMLTDETSVAPKKKEPIRDVGLIERMKADIQETVYRGGKTQQEELKEIMRDYRLRHAEEREKRCGTGNGKDGYKMLQGTI